jgi:hypothetical protein
MVRLMPSARLVMVTVVTTWPHHCDHMARVMVCTQHRKQWALTVQECNWFLAWLQPAWCMLKQFDCFNMQK